MKTLDKLKEICDPFGVTFEYHIEGGDWYITFDAPPKMCWVQVRQQLVVTMGAH